MELKLYICESRKELVVVVVVVVVVGAAAAAVAVSSSSHSRYGWKSPFLARKNHHKIEKH